MRIPCPLCGTRDRREFTYQGDALALDRPQAGAGAGDWHAYLHLRDNPAGPVRDLWYHDPCQSWLVVSRDTVTHEITAAELAASAPRRAVASRAKARGAPKTGAAKTRAAKTRATTPRAGKKPGAGR